MSVSQDMTILRVLQLILGAIDVLVKHGMMGCANCSGAASKSIQRGAQIYGVDLEKLLNELNHLQLEK